VTGAGPAEAGLAGQPDRAGQQADGASAEVAPPSAPVKRAFLRAMPARAKTVPVETVPVEAGPVEAGPAEAGPAETVPVETVPGDLGLGDLGLGEAEGESDSEDLPLWDWSAPGDRAVQDEPAATPADPAKPEWKPVVTPVEETADGARPPGIGEGRGNLAHLAANPRIRAWRLRIIVAAIVMLGFSLWVSWKLGLTLAVVVIIADTIYRSRRGYPGVVRLTGAQRRTKRQLAKLGRAGYRAMHARPIPESEEQIDHLVVGPTGVFAIDSEDWDKHLVVRTKKGTQLWHGPFSKKDRLQHAQWEAQRAADMISGEIGKPVTVRPAMAVYGPRIPWDVATIRDVDVFSGPRLRKYLRRRARQEDVRRLTDTEIEKIYEAAGKAFPHLSSGSRAS
jgi:Nuclease-related domain